MATKSKAAPKVAPAEGYNNPNAKDNVAQNEQPDELYLKVSQDFAAAKAYVRNSYWSKWQQCWKLYNNQRVQVGYEGIADTFDPITYGITETIVANVFSQKPKWNFTPTDPDQFQETKALNAMADHYWERNEMDLKVPVFGREAVVTGNGFLIGGWGEDGFTVDHYPNRDCFADPNCGNDFNKAKYFSVVFFGDREVMEQEEVIDVEATIKAQDEADAAFEKQMQAAVAAGEEFDEDSQQIVEPVMKKKYKNLHLCKEETQDGDITQKEMFDQQSGSEVTGEATTGQMKVVRTYYIAPKPMIVEFSGGQIIYEEKDYPFQKEAEDLVIHRVEKDATTGGMKLLRSNVRTKGIKPFLPVMPQRLTLLPGLFYGKGIVEVIGERQEQLNDVENQDLDNGTYRLNNMWGVDPKFKDMVPKIQSIPGAVYAMPQGALYAIEKPLPDGNWAENKELQIKASMREAVGADEITGGVRPDNAATATQITAQMNQAGQKFQLQINGFEAESLTRMAKIMVWMMQIFMTDTQMVKVMERTGIDWQEFDIVKFWGEWEPRVQLEIKAQALQEAESAKAQAIYADMKDDPYIEQMELRRFTLERAFDLDADEIQKLLKAKEDIPALGPDGQPIQPGMGDPNAAAAGGGTAIPQVGPDGQPTGPEDPMTHTPSDPNAMPDPEVTQGLDDFHGDNQALEAELNGSKAA